MKKLSKIITLTIALIMSASTFSAVGCGKKVPDTDQTLQVYCYDAGYGTAWCTALLDLFKEQDWVKEKYPELIEKYQIPLDEYPRRCVKQINEWNERKELLVTDAVEHTVSNEFASLIIGAKMGGQECRIHGNVMNNGLITNLPYNCCVEVPCLVDSSGINPCYIGDLPEQCAALNRTNINVQNLTVEGAFQRSKELIYMAAYFDPHASSELSMDEIKAMCDDLFESHKQWLPEYH